MSKFLEFEDFPKISRFNRDVVVTEKIDGTNAQVCVYDCLKVEENSVAPPPIGDHWKDMGDGIYIAAGSRTRWLTPKEDNFGFARWVWENAGDLVYLGAGRHFGEWWGQGIQRTYGLDEKRFSLFNTSRWTSEHNLNVDESPFYGQITACIEVPRCHVTPILNYGTMSEINMDDIVSDLRVLGSVASPGFMKPEGVVLFHTAANTMFKQTLEKDDVPKSIQQ